MPPIPQLFLSIKRSVRYYKAVMEAVVSIKNLELPTAEEIKKKPGKRSQPENGG